MSSVLLHGFGGLLIVTIVGCRMTSTSPLVSSGDPSSAAAAPTASHSKGPTWTCPPQGQQIIPQVEASVPSGQVVEAVVTSVGAMICGEQVIGDALVDPTEPLLAAAGDRIRLTLADGWQVVRVEVTDRPFHGGAANVTPPIEPTGPSSWVEIPSPARPGDSLLSFSLFAVTEVGASRLDVAASLWIQQR